MPAERRRLTRGGDSGTEALAATLGILAFQEEGRVNTLVTVRPLHVFLWGWMEIGCGSGVEDGLDDRVGVGLKWVIKWLEGSGWWSGGGVVVEWVL